MSPEPEIKNFYCIWNETQTRKTLNHSVIWLCRIWVPIESLLKLKQYNSEAI